ncbi:MAG: hypothetical protein ACRCUT_08325, partial [Spirochaetota bacterium]
MEFSDEFDTIREIASSRISTQEGMKILISLCAIRYPDELWDRAAKIDFRTEADLIAAWVTDAVGKDQYPDNIEALWFSLCSPGEESGIDLRLSGSECFIRESDGFFEDIIFSESYIPSRQ